jgi:DNA-directed RNA polymerase subunit RPC12/RpoP
MSSKDIMCPKCGAPNAKSLKPDLYVCSYCGSKVNAFVVGRY